MNQDRINKMQSVLKEILSLKLLELTLEIQNEFGIININSVVMAPDMWYLDVFVSSLYNQDILCKTLAKYAQDLKHEINKNITLRKTPIIRFRYDKTNETTIDLTKKIDALKIN